MSRYAINDAILFDLAIVKARKEYVEDGVIPWKRRINAAKIHDSLYSASAKTVHHRLRKFGRARSRAKNT